MSRPAVFFIEARAAVLGRPGYRRPPHLTDFARRRADLLGVFWRERAR
jgi:hypothetical protein